MLHWKYKASNIFKLCHLQATSNNLCTSSTGTSSVIQKMLGISNEKAQLMVFRQPSLSKFEPCHLQQVTKVVEELGIDKLELTEVPVLFTCLPITLKYRYTILKECGFEKINLRLVSKYLSLVKKDKVSQLKSKGLIPQNAEVCKNLASIFTSWPTSNSQSLLKFDEDTFSLHEIRMKILQRYLELLIDLPEDEFINKFKIYLRIKHKPFKLMNEMLELLLYHILMPTDKIKSNLFVVSADPENVKQLIYKIPTIGGRSMKDIIKMYPKYCTTNVENFIKMRDLFIEYGISENKQARCLEIYTLSHKTVRERLENLKSIPNFEVFKDHPRVLKIIIHNKIAMERLKILKNSTKKCFSLNVLSGSKLHYKMYQESPGDRTKGKDLVYGIHSCLDNIHTADKLRENLKVHPFWLNVPLLQAISVSKHLLGKFSSSDIFENCVILLYPWDNIERVLKSILNNEYQTFMCDSEQSKCFGRHNTLQHIEFDKLTNSQILSLTLYLLEKDHYFSGNGIWTNKKLSQDEITMNETVLGNEVAKMDKNVLNLQVTNS